MDFSLICRTCLKTEYLNPIFPNSQNWCRYSNAVHITTGIKIAPDDGLPQQICSICVHFINQSLKFRKSCKDVQIKLLETVDIKMDPDKIQNENSKDFIVYSGGKIQSTEIKVEVEDISDLPEQQFNHKTSTDFETLIDEDKDDIPLSELKETEPDNNIQEISHDVKSSCDNLYSLNDASESRNKRVTCKLCQKNLSIRSIDIHMAKAHPGADERKTKCELCDSYLLKEKMKRHMNMKHGIKKGQDGNFVRCSYCKTEFDSKEILKQHFVNCTDKKKRRKVYKSSRELAECDVCKKKMLKASLRLHKAMAHAGKKPICEHCGRAFGNKFRLKEHYRAKHGYDKFKCPYCDFETAGVMSMQNHLRKHRGEKPYVCDTCGAKFHAAYLLAQHKQSHITERPLKCEICSATFKTSNSLHTHKKACHGPPIYKCTVCPKSYSCKHYAVKHMRRAHRFEGPLPVCELIDKEVV